MSELKVTGTITSIEDVVTGKAKSTGNEWAKVGFVINTGGEYPKDIYFSLFGVDKVDKFKQFNKVGDNVEVSFEPSSREYEGKWYNDNNAWKVWGLDRGASPVPAGNEEEDDLPF